MAEAAPKEHNGAVVAMIRQIGAMSIFRRDAPIVNNRQAIGWWETRRIPYNLIVGSSGIFTCIVIAIVGMASYFFFNSDFGVPDPPLFAIFGVILYGMLANVCFTGGWIVELLVRRLWPEEADRFATTTFTLGLFLSVLLTLTPAIVIGVAGIFKLVNRFLGAAHQ